MSDRTLLRDYLCHSYLYYALDDPIVSDHEFDALCLRINEAWDDLHGPDKLFLVEHGERSGYVKGLSLLPEQYPERIRLRAEEMRRDHEDLRAAMGF